ncbi:cytochrome c biogenesis protein ResB [Bacteriovoracaceae bacterium]|nr:cytochrome c biogenesis protein ResB [Bacteriovoracaceae bacterium]
MQNTKESKLITILNKIENTLGGLKCAVTLILIFTVGMVVGTFFESYYGTEFAGKTIYKTWWFMSIQGLMFLSIVFATFRRLPPKKRLYGFYTIHLGLILIGCGSFVTYYAGVDGSILLQPNTPAREIILPQDVLKIEIPDEGRVVTYRLPNSAFKTSLDEIYKDIKLVDFLPYAEKKFQWQDSKNSYSEKEPLHSSEYLISNDNVSQQFLVSLHPESIEYEGNVTLGPLTIHYLPNGLAKCFAFNNKSKLILWDRESVTCNTPEEINVPVKVTKTGSRFLVIEKDGGYLSFFPDASPWPMDEKLNMNQQSSIRVFSKKLFEDKPNLFLFGEKIAFYDKDEQKWEVREFNSSTTKLDLPWMGFELSLLQHQEKKVPINIPVPTWPIQKNNQLIKGNLKAVSLEVKGKNYWLTNERAMTLLIAGKKMNFILAKDSLVLPFEFVLTRFKMDKDPGTNSPASYESFVRLFTEDGPSDHHIYMNNPLKHEGFTFYQASYSQDRQGNYSSTLSANVDQGRAIKYLGSLLLFIGSLLHYHLNFRTARKDNVSPLINNLES